LTRFFLSLLAAASFFASPALANDQPVVVELYTSQGCSSCPPADAYLHKLAERGDVIALALHVDYWDYIGWKDSFGSPEWSTRQRDYAKSADRTMVYTPQMIINGADHVVGNRPKDVDALVRAHKAKPLPVALRVARDGKQLRISAEGAASGGPFMVQLVRFKAKETVKITRGENAGRTLSYANIVTEIKTLRTWNGRNALNIETVMSGDQPGVVLIQKEGVGPVVAAARVR